MKRAILVLLLLSAHSFAQVYLRSGSAPVAISGATNTTPITITATGHGFSNGDIVYIYYVLGNTNANGLRKVKNATTNTFEITTLADVDVAGNGTFSAAANPIVGKVTQFTPQNYGLWYKSSILARVQDPDGSGSQKAPVVANGSPCTPEDRSGCTLWDALENRLSGKTSAGCDGETPSLCTAEASWSSSTTLLAAMGWFADQSRTEWLNGVKYNLRVMPSVDGMSGARFTACDESSYHCGTGSFNDWASEEIGIYSHAYSLVRSQLSSVERQYIANRIFNDISDGCTNQLQKQSGTASITSGSAIVTGSGLSVYEPGDVIMLAMVYPTSAAKGLWAKVASVESDAQLTLTENVSVTASGRDHYRVMPWTATTCGVNWYVSHHGYAPAVLARKGGHAITAAMDASQTYFTVADISNYLDPPPFLVKIDSEYMVVTEISGTGPYTLTVTRGALYKTPATHSAGKIAMWENYAQWGYGMTGEAVYLGPYTHNLAVQKLYGYLFVGAAFYQDDPRATGVLEKAWNYWYDLTIRSNKRRWTGATGGASNPNYHLRRWLSYTFPAVMWAKHSLSPSLDISDGDWLKSAAYYLPYLQYPHSIRYTPLYADSGGEIVIENDDVAYLAIMQELFAGTDEAAYSNYWMRNKATSTPPGFLHFNMTATALGDKTTPYYLAFTDSSQTSTDYTSILNPWRFFTGVDETPNEPYALMVSRTGWSSSDDTHVTMIATRNAHDHWHAQSGPGNYKIAKKTKLLDDNGAGGLGGGANTNYVEVGGATNLLTARTTSFDRQRGENEFVYARVNNSGVYTSTAAVTSAYRHLWHLKGIQDYVVAYDVVNTSSTKQKKLRLHYYRGDLTSDHSLTRTDGDVVFTKSTTARLSSKILLPVESEKITHTEAPSSYAYTVTVDDGSTTQSEFLVVHRPSGNVGDSMPTVELLESVSSGWRGARIDNSWVLLVSKSGVESGVSFTTSNSAKIIVSGLAPGNYDVERDGSQIDGSPFSVGVDGTLYFESQSGVIVVGDSPPMVLGVTPTSLAFTKMDRGVSNLSGTITATCTGGSCTAVVSESCGWLTVTPESGAAPVVFSVVADASGMNPGVYSCTITVTATGAENSPTNVDASLTITTNQPFGGFVGGSTDVTGARLQ